MPEGNWKCSKCGAAITSLPFEPRSSEGLTCRDCYQKGGKGGGSGSGSTPSASSQTSDRPLFEGNWTCAGCGAAITKLPFMPRNTDNLKCIDCFRNNK